MVRAALAMLAVLAVLAGCGTADSSTPQAAATGQAVATATSPAAASSGPVPEARLTMRQARRAYARIAGPADRAGTAVNQDAADQVPLSRFRSDVRAQIIAFRTAAAKLAAVRWPARVVPYVSAMTSTDMPAGIACGRDLLAARSYVQVIVISRNQACTTARNSDNASTIRTVLGLPPASAG